MIKLDKKEKATGGRSFDRSKLNRNLNRGRILVPHLDKVFETFDEPWEFKYEEKKSDDAWHPSGDCIPVASALYKKASTNERESIGGSLRKTFMVGHFWHQLLQHIILHKLEFCAPEAVEVKGINVWGWGDDTMPAPYQWATGAGDIAPLDTGKWQGVLDIKTMSAFQFNQPTLPEWAAAKYTAQINIYMDFFDLEQGVILAVNKDSPHEFKEFPFVRDQALIDAIYRKWKFVGECIAQDVIPLDVDDVEYALPI